jgi:8-oxo-dGTP pyrophosphatase MutT (NUDIX family)
MAEKYSFQYCQKIVLFDDQERVLLARRKDEADFDGVFSFIGGKMERVDTRKGTGNDLLEGVRREKQQEIGRRALILVAPQLSYDIYFTKKDGSGMVLPRIYERYVSGAIDLNTSEYSEYQWVEMEELDAFEPKIETIPTAVRWAGSIRDIISEDDLSAI